MKIAYFDCFSGISGNMILGAFLDAGLPLDYLKNELNKLNLPDSYKFVTERVQKKGISAYYFDVDLSHHHHHNNHTHESSAPVNSPNHNSQPHQHRGLQEIVKIIEESSLAPKIKDLALRIFNELGQAEAKVHNCSVRDIHFHEVGAVDAIIDIVGAAIAFDYFKIEKVLASPLHVGKGTVKCAHGLMPVPAPATAELLKGAAIYSTDIQGELVTPTGAAIITTLTNEFVTLPPLQIETVSYGAGTWDLDIPNVLRLYLGNEGSNGDWGECTIIETNIDDMNPEFYGHLLDKLFQAGAADAYLTPIYMKKNRPAALLTVICSSSSHQPFLDIIFAETTTLGIRMHKAQRCMLHRDIVSVETPYGSVRLKVGRQEGEITNIAPEYEDCRKLAEESGQPLKDIYQEALTLGFHKLK